MSHLLMKVIGFFIVVGAIFAGGAFIGGSWATSSAQDSQRVQIEQCLPVTTTDQLDACLSEGSR